MSPGTNATLCLSGGMLSKGSLLFMSSVCLIICKVRMSRQKIACVYVCVKLCGVYTIGCICGQHCDFSSCDYVPVSLCNAFRTVYWVSWTNQSAWMLVVLNSFFPLGEQALFSTDFFCFSFYFSSVLLTVSHNLREKMAKRKKEDMHKSLLSWYCSCSFKLTLFEKQQEVFVYMQSAESG